MSDSAHGPDILARLRRGEASAFDLVYEHFRPRVFSFLARLTLVRAVAEELTQETFLRLARHAPSLAEDTKLGAWLFTVARNLARDHRRRRLLQQDSLSTLALWPTRRQAPPSPLDLAEADESRRRLESALSRLPDVQRETILLVTIEGFSAEAAATIIDVNAATLRKRVSRGRALLQELMREPASSNSTRVDTTITHPQLREEPS